MWERERSKGEDAEIQWCEWKGVQHTTLRVTSEAKYQLISKFLILLIKSLTNVF